MRNNKLIGEWSITVLLIGVILLLVVPLLFGAGYTYPAADDFVFENGSTEWANLFGPHRGRLMAAWNYYMTWQGTYISNLLLFTVLPFIRLGLTGFRIVMVLLSLFFVLSLFFMVDGIINFSQSLGEEDNRRGRRNKKLFLYAVLLFAALGLPGTWIGKEVFFWYTGAAVYLVGICNLFLSIGCFFLANCRERTGRRHYICSVLFGFIASGTSPQVASFVCSWHLIALLVVILSAESVRKQLHFWNICPFLASFLGAVINSAAPGNFRRSKLTMDEQGINYGMIDAIKNTFVCQKGELKQILHDPFFIVLAITLFLVWGYFELRTDKKEKNITWIGVLCMVCSVLISQFLCIFPVLLGYHSKALDSNRTKYIAEFEIRFSLIFAIIFVARYVSQKLSEKVKCNRNFCLAVTLFGVFICVAGFIFQTNPAKKLGYGYSFELIREFSNGTVQEVFSLRKEVLDALESAEDGTDVNLQLPPLPSTRVTYSQGLYSDPGEQNNQAAASMFNLGSVTVEYDAQ
ncbi:MAG: hypothetical protein J1E98_10180 [Lachnospiraceae bacterium]|nr:hypothetical protein [Lachnospiraceae bacterium]